VSFRDPKRPLYLTEEEAMGLLELCLYSQEETDPVKAAAMHKLADFCRDFLSVPSDQQSVHDPDAVERYLKRRSAIAACG
jgi:hypothetical protein